MLEYVLMSLTDTVVVCDAQKIKIKNMHTSSEIKLI